MGFLWAPLNGPPEAQDVTLGCGSEGEDASGSEGHWPKLRQLFFFFFTLVPAPVKGPALLYSSIFKELQSGRKCLWKIIEGFGNRVQFRSRADKRGSCPGGCFPCLSFQICFICFNPIFAELPVCLAVSSQSLE